MSQEMVIFSRSFDLLTWILPTADKFPKAQRFVVTQRLTGAALDMQEALFHANTRGVAIMRQFAWSVEVPLAAFFVDDPVGVSAGHSLWRRVPGE